ncbi:TonB-dependent receptor [Glycocaulis albus]|uniref:TonB-dependent receptor n=1 Tax=Glycocaulis albus TaxID=1382801 RepID=A0ABQ1Y0G5_9PROT|nr:TonB-dependent receptor [Glycocaulis albus]GGH07899.1 TonB-dependent receptor [Glycocaulis albus]
MKKWNKEALLRTSVLAGFVAASAAAAPALAQEAEEEGATQQRETIQVTGSRIQRQDFTAASPITTVGIETIQLSQTLTLESLLNELPQVIPGNNQSSNNAGGFGFATLDLRGLGTNRNLLLVNGIRLPPSSTTGTVSLDNIPTGLIERIEVVTGGASTVYGSDAISGVANFILRDDYEGAEVSYTYAFAEDGPASARHGVDFLLGGNFDNGRGNLAMYGSYYARDGVFQSAFDYSRTSAAIYGIVSGGAVVGSFIEDDPASFIARRDAEIAAGNSVIQLFSGGSATPPWGSVNNNATNPFQGLAAVLPGQFAAADLDCNPATPGQPYNSGNLAFDDNGNLVPYFGASGTACAIPAGTSRRYNFAPDNYIVIPAERYNFAVFGSYELGNGVEMTASVMYSEITNTVELAATPATGLTVSASNSFIPADLAAALATRPNPTADFVMNYRFNSVGTRVSDFTNRSLMAQVGFEGDFNANWSWQAAAIYSKVDAINDSRNSINRTALAQGLSGCPAVGALPGCVELNIFGPNTLDADMVSFLRTDTRSLDFSERNHFMFFVNGDLMQLPAGPVGVAAGVEYREDSAGRVVDDAQRNGDIFGFNAVQSLGGSVRIAELYAEAAVPLVANQPFIEYLGLELGYRVSDYSTAGTVDTFKIGGEWAPVDWFRFRTMFNRATRAPSAFELFQNGDQGFPAYTDPCNDTPARTAATAAFCIAQGVPAAAITGFNQNNTQVQAFAFGQPDLGPETADTFTIGFTSSPPIPFGTLNLAVDYYDIEIVDVISTRGAGTIIGSCFASGDLTSSDCQRIQRRTDNGQIDFVNTGRQNSGFLQTKGVDVQVDFQMDLPLFGMDGTLGVNNLYNHLEEWNSNGTDLRGITYGQIGSAYPEYTNTLTLTYALPSVATQLRWVHTPSLSDGWFGIGNAFIDDTPAVNYIDLSVRWDVTDALSLTVGAQNLTDEIATQTAGGVIGGQGNTDPQVYRALGRMWSLSVRSRF